MGVMELYNQWLKDFSNDPETVQDLMSIADNPAEIEDRFYRELEFGTAGMRGVMGAGTNRLNIYNVRRVSMAFAKYINTIPGGAEKGVAIAFDSRNNSPRFAKEAALVLANNGVKVYLYDTLRPVPVLSFTVRHLGCIAGVVITASHNPSPYNGYKVYWTDGGQMPPDSVQGLIDFLPETTYAQAQPMDENIAREKGLLVSVPAEVDDAYIATVKKLCVNPELAEKAGKELKIVYTPLHGSGNLPVRRIFKEIGMENVYVVPEQELPDGNFPTVRVPNPEEKDAFTLAVAMQKELGADLCVGTDPDCDRVGIACLTGDGDVRLLNGNQIGCVLLDYILSQKKERGELPANAAAVSTIVSTKLAKAICDHYGAQFFEVLTGFKFIAETIQRFEDTGSNTFMFGFEESYGFLSGTEVRDKDGVNACMLIAEAAAYYRQKGMTLADAVDELFEKFGHYCERTVSFTLPGKDGLAKMKEVMADLRSSTVKEIGGKCVLASRDYQTSVRTDKDGNTEKILLPASNVLYYELDGGNWVCVRPSGTEPKIKLYVGVVTPSAQETEKAIAEMADAALALLKSKM